MSDAPSDWMPADVKPVLAEFEGKPVLSTGIAITGAGDGLSKALAIDPAEYHQGETVYVVSECLVRDVKFTPIKDTNGVQRVHVLKAGVSTVVDPAVVKDAIAAQAAKIETAERLKKGEHKMPLPENLQEEHDAGGHSMGLVPGCPTCDLEVEVKAAEQADAEGTPPPAVRPIGSGRTRNRSKPKAETAPAEGGEPQP